VRDNSNIDRDRSHRVDREIAKIADRQQINITRAQLISVGVDDDGIRYRRRKGNLYLIHRAVYSVGRPARLGPERASAAVLACGGGAALADEAAAASWGFRKWPYPPYTVFDERERRHKGINTRRVKLHPKDIRRHEGIRVTSPARTALDLAAHLPDKQLKRAIDEARMSPTARLTLNQLRDVVARYPHHPGAKRVRWFLGITQEEPNRSGYEDEFDEFCEERGFPRPRRLDHALGRVRRRRQQRTGGDAARARHPNPADQAPALRGEPGSRGEKAAQDPRAAPARERARGLGAGTQPVSRPDCPAAARARGRSPPRSERESSPRG
jgi:hypothetical protein